MSPEKDKSSSLQDNVDSNQRIQIQNNFGTIQQFSGQQPEGGKKSAGSRIPIIVALIPAVGAIIVVLIGLYGTMHKTNPVAGSNYRVIDYPNADKYLEKAQQEYSEEDVAKFERTTYTRRERWHDCMGNN